MTAYRASITSTAVWLRVNSEYGDHLFDVCPFWAQRPAAICLQQQAVHDDRLPLPGGAGTARP
ncbi:hypothetical protein [Streptomyces canus]|uniref:hypothetical protein n=1 Tax=Streptomyces canus TaxID=58343 RepID=UPI00371D31C5